MARFDAPGLQANWLNAWLAALGITVLVPEARLSWTDDERPHAVFDHGDLIAHLAAAFPTRAHLDAIAIARQHPASAHPFPRKPTGAAYRDRAHLARLGDFSLTSTVTDLVHGSDELPHSPFDPPFPKGITLHDRVLACRNAIHDELRQCQESLTGVGTRVQGSGLGFDYLRRFQPTVPHAEDHVDPVIELLAFFGLSFIHVRGDGNRERVRGWSAGPLHRHAFTWPTWRQAITAPAIDALLDSFWSHADTTNTDAVFASVSYQPRGSLDATRGFASERIR